MDTPVSVRKIKPVIPGKCRFCSLVFQDWPEYVVHLKDDHKMDLRRENSIIRTIERHNEKRDKEETLFEGYTTDGQPSARSISKTTTGKFRYTIRGTRNP